MLILKLTLCLQVKGVVFRASGFNKLGYGKPMKLSLSIARNEKTRRDEERALREVNGTENGAGSSAGGTKKGNGNIKAGDGKNVNGTGVNGNGQAGNGSAVNGKDQASSGNAPKADSTASTSAASASANGSK